MNVALYAPARVMVVVPELDWVSCQAQEPPTEQSVLAALIDTCNGFCVVWHIAVSAMARVIIHNNSNLRTMAFSPAPSLYVAVPPTSLQASASLHTISLAESFPFRFSLVTQ
jgi:hypothetical protein